LGELICRDKWRAKIEGDGVGKHQNQIIEDADATGEVAEAYDYWRASSGRKQIPGVLKSLSARPDS